MSFHHNKAPKSLVFLRWEAEESCGFTLPAFLWCLWMICLFYLSVSAQQQSVFCLFMPSHTVNLSFSRLPAVRKIVHRSAQDNMNTHSRENTEDMTLLLFSPKRVWNYRDKLARNRKQCEVITASRLFVRKSFPPHNLANCCSRSKFYLMAALSRLSSQRPSNIQSCRHGDSPYLQTSTCMESLRYIQPKTSLTSAH